MATTPPAPPRCCITMFSPAPTPSSPTPRQPAGTRGAGRLTGWLFGSRAGDGDARSGSPSNLAGRGGVGMVDRAPPVNNPFRVSGTAEDGAGALLFATSLSQIRQAAAATEAA